MKLNNEKWLACVVKACKDTKAQPTSGVVCAIATLRYVRDEMLEQVKGSATEKDDSAIIGDFFNGADGLIKAVIEAKQLNGFASNASAAAKAAKLETRAVDMVNLSA